MALPALSGVPPSRPGPGVASFAGRASVAAASRAGAAGPAGRGEAPPRGPPSRRGRSPRDPSRSRHARPRRTQFARLLALDDLEQKHDALVEARILGQQPLDLAVAQISDIGRAGRPVPRAAGCAMAGAAPPCRRARPCPMPVAAGCPPTTVKGGARPTPRRVSRSATTISSIVGSRSTGRMVPLPRPRTDPVVFSLIYGLTAEFDPAPEPPMAVGPAMF